MEAIVSFYEFENSGPIFANVFPKGSIIERPPNLRPNSLLELTGSGFLNPRGNTSIFSVVSNSPLLASGNSVSEISRPRRSSLTKDSSGADSEDKEDLTPLSRAQEATQKVSVKELIAQINARITLDANKNRGENEKSSKFLHDFCHLDRLRMIQVTRNQILEFAQFFLYESHSDCMFK